MGLALSGLCPCPLTLRGLARQAWKVMTAPRVPTIGDRTVRRIPWADLADSSQEVSKDETLLVPAAPVVDDSYDTPALGFDNSRDGMNSRFKKMETLHEAVNSGPLNF